ncbi:unnamed protein product, partial [Meganyctiphanes norvegica]
QVIVLTDGEVWNVKQVTDLIGRNSHNTRLFSVGVGSGASSALVKGMARAGRGRYEMVQDHTNLQVKVMSLLQSMVQESVQEVTVSCNVEPISRVTLVPPAPPVIFGGRHLTLYARIISTTKVLSVTIKGRVGAQECTVSFNGSEITQIHDANLSLHRLAARSQILAWEIDDEENNKESIIRLSEASGVVSRWTALVGVDQDGNQSYYGSEAVQNRNQCQSASSSNIFGSLFGCSAAGSMQQSNRSPMGACSFGSTGSAPPMFGSSGSSFGSAPPGSMQQSNRSPMGAGSFGFQSDNSSTLFGSSSSGHGGYSSFGGGISCAAGGHTQMANSSKLFGFSGNISPMSQHIPEGSTEAKFPKSPVGLSGLVQLQQFDGSWKLDTVAKFMNASLDSLLKKCPIQKLDSDLHYESMRLKTFIKWPLNFVDPVELATNGFFYTSSADNCVCIF